MMQTAALLGFDTRITGSTNDYEKTSGSDVVVITSGIPRKPGMTREDLIGTNAGIVKTVCENILRYSPDAIIIIISNPMDTMTYLALQATGIPKNRIIGMGGTLDSSRFKYQLSQRLGCSAADLNAVVIGGHGVPYSRRPGQLEIGVVEVTRCMPASANRWSAASACAVKSATNPPLPSGTVTADMQSVTR